MAASLTTLFQAHTTVSPYPYSFQFYSVGLPRWGVSYPNAPSVDLGAALSKAAYLSSYNELDKFLRVLVSSVSPGG